MSSYQYRKYHCGDKTVERSSYLHNGISYTGKMSSLYWFSPLIAPIYSYPSICISINVYRDKPSIDTSRPLSCLWNKPINQKIGCTCLHWFEGTVRPSCIAVNTMKHTKAYRAYHFSLPYTNQRLMIHISDLMMIKWSTHIPTIAQREIGKMKTQYHVLQNESWDNVLDLTHTHDIIYLISILYDQCFQTSLHNNDIEIVYKWMRPLGHFVPNFCAHHWLR